MSGKLTLYIDDDLIAYVKDYAKAHRLSVSRVVNNFLSTLKEGESKRENPHNEDSAPITHSLRGILTQPDIQISDYHKYLEEKYL